MLSIQKEHTDLELVEIFKKKKSQWVINVLYERYHHLVLGVCLKFLRDKSLAQDTSNEVFEIIMEKLAVSNVNIVNAWVFTIAKNHCFSVLKTRKKDRVFKENYKIENNFVEFPQETTLTSEQAEKKLIQAIEELNDAQKQCILLFFWEKKSYRQIVEKTGFTLKEVKSYLQNGKRNLKVKLSE